MRSQYFQAHINLKIRDMIGLISSDMMNEQLHRQKGLAIFGQKLEVLAAV